MYEITDLETKNCFEALFLWLICRCTFLIRICGMKTWINYLQRYLRQISTHTILWEDFLCVLSYPCIPVHNSVNCRIKRHK